MIKEEYVKKMTKEEYEREKEKAMKGGLSYRMNCCGKVTVYRPSTPEEKEEARKWLAARGIKYNPQ